MVGFDLSLTAWSARSIRAASHLALRAIDLEATGVDVIPRTGPLLLVARHVHHLYDGCAVVTLAPRPVRVMAALDWVQHPVGARAMTAACRAAGWPVVYRNRPDEAATPGEHTPSAAGIRESVRVLAAGGALLIFPEAYPNIDPGYTPKPDVDTMLPFLPGAARIAALTERVTRQPVAVCPIGLAYDWDARPRPRLTIRFGAPRFLASDAAGDPARLGALIEADVHRLSH